MKDVQEIFWTEIYPKRHQSRQEVLDKGIFISSVLKTDDSEQYAFIDRLQEKYPFLSKHMFVFDMPPYFATPIHLDNGPEERERINGKRLLSINIPIEGCGPRCPTEFFKVAPEDLVFIRSANVTAVFPDAPRELVDQYVLEDCPILTNTQEPHRVNNLENDGTRISLSWTVKDTWQWDEVVNFFRS